MGNSKWFTGMACLLTAGGLLLGGSGAATAAAPSTDTPTEISGQADTSSEDSQIRAELKKWGVPSASRAQLMKDLRNGRVWDSLAGKQPVSTETRAENGSDVTIKRYADGSFQATTVAKPTRVIDLGDTPFEAAKARASVSTMGTMMGCTVYNGSGYSVNRGCSISNSWGVVVIAFVADYSILNGAYDTIDGLGATTQKCAGYTCTRPDYVVRKMREDGYGAAQVSAQSTVTGAGQSYEVWVALNVGGNRAWVSNS